MFRLSEMYMNSDQNGKNHLLQVLFDMVEQQQDQISKLQHEVAQLSSNSQPLNRIAKSPKSWHPRFSGNDAS